MHSIAHIPLKCLAVNKTESCALVKPSYRSTDLLQPSKTSQHKPLHSKLELGDLTC